MATVPLWTVSHGLGRRAEVGDGFPNGFDGAGKVEADGVGQGYGSQEAHLAAGLDHVVR